MPSDPETTLDSSFLTDPLLRFYDLDVLQKKMDMTCKPTVSTGKWYRIEFGQRFLLNPRSVHCYSNKDQSDVFTEAFTPIPSASVETGAEVEKGAEVETVEPEAQSKVVSSSKKPVFLLSVVALLGVAGVFGVVLGSKKEEERAFVNNRITAPRAESQYGTFHFSVCLGHNAIGKRRFTECVLCIMIVFW